MSAPRDAATTPDAVRKRAQRNIERFGVPVGTDDPALLALGAEPMTAVEWTYGCPAEGTHIVDPNELWVGVIRHTKGFGEWVLVAAVIPPFTLGDGRTSQAEPLAKEACDAFRARSDDWKHPDGLAAWLHAHGHHMGRSDWPASSASDSADGDDS